MKSASKEMETLPFSYVKSWWELQASMQELIRFKKYSDTTRYGRVPRQNNSQHINSFLRFASEATAELLELIHFDRALLLDAVTYHDDGETIVCSKSGRDNYYFDKVWQKDVDEYLAFMQSIESKPRSVRVNLEQAFLLQFVTTHQPDIFPLTGASTLQLLSKRYLLEAIIFKALERIDYLHLPLYAYITTGNEMMLTQVLRNQFDPIEVLAEKVPELKKTVWTVEQSTWCKSFMTKNEGKWPERKSKLV